MNHPFARRHAAQNRRLLVALALSALLSACSTAPAFVYAPPAHPEAASGLTEKTGWTTQRFAVAAANPLATDAGYQILKAGGSALDAAVAVQMVLTLVEPQSSGIGGGSFLLHFDGQRTQAFDGRETAPAAATPDLFTGPDGKPLAFAQALVGGRAVGVPGTVRMLEAAHRQHGKLPWATLFQPAITLAQSGFPVSHRLHTLLAADPHLKKDPVAATHYFDALGQPWPVGHILKNPALANVLQRIAAEGSTALHEGEIAQAIVDKVRQHPTNPGRLSTTDMARYTSVEREPLCHDHDTPVRVYRICGMPPPSSGAIAIGQILGILNQTAAHRLPLEDGLPSADWLHLYTEAARLAFADRAAFVADPGFVPAPGGNWSNLLETSYLAERARLIGPTSLKTAPAGQPGAVRTSFAPMPEQIEYGTSHISIVDANGKALAMTSSIEDAFGARQMVRGFLLNNELTDFSFAPVDTQGRPVANRVEAGKRPRSSMAPTLVFDKASGQFLMSLGSPGGAAIIHYTAKVLVGTLHWGLNVQQAINLPNFGSMNGPSLLEEKRFPVQTVEALRLRGAEVREGAQTSGLQAIEKTSGGWFGGADPRREGVVRGD